jgi:aldehyde dehydrogenase (NAD+)
MIAPMTDYQELLKKQRDFFLSGKTLSLEFRREQLLKLRAEVIRKHEDIEHSLKKDIGKSEFEAFATEVTAILDEINNAVENLEAWTKPIEAETPPVLGEGESRIYYDPYGIILIINTWNYPFVLCFKPLIGALAAGNCCIVKPSEVAPTASKVLAEIINACFEEDYCRAIEGGTEEVVALLKQRFDFILYTGSTRVGRIVAQAAAQHLTPTVLELGGKSPCIVDESADIERSVATICWGKYINSGQTCTSPDYVWVHQNIKEKLIEALKRQITDFYGAHIKENADFGRIIHKRHFDRLTGLMTEGRIVFGGETDENQLFISPTIIDGITWESKIMQEEIFGPILPVLTYESMEDVVTELKKREKPLALYLYTTDKNVEEFIINNVQYGGGCINATLMHMLNTNLPFGGVGSSGHGFYQGRWSVEMFSHRKSVLKRALSDEPSPMFPPYEGKAEFLKSIYL